VKKALRLVKKVLQIESSPPLKLVVAGCPARGGAIKRLIGSADRKSGSVAQFFEGKGRFVQTFFIRLELTRKSMKTED